MISEPLTRLLREIPPEVLAKTLDAVLIDYSILSVRDQQSVDAENAVLNIQNMKRIRDAFNQASKQMEANCLKQ